MLSQKEDAPLFLRQFGDGGFDPLLQFRVFDDGVGRAAGGGRQVVQVRGFSNPISPEAIVTPGIYRQAVRYLEQPAGELSFLPVFGQRLQRFDKGVLEQILRPLAVFPLFSAFAGRAGDVECRPFVRVQVIPMPTVKWPLSCRKAGLFTLKL